MNNARLVTVTRAAHILSLLTTAILYQERLSRAMEAAHTHPLPVLLVIRVMRPQEVSLRLLNLLKLDLPMEMTPLKLKKDQVEALQVIITMGRRQV
jgi:hypothetical protein